MKNLFLKGGRSGGGRSLGGDDDTLDGKCSVHPEMRGKMARVRVGWVGVQILFAQRGVLNESHQGRNVGETFSRCVKLDGW